MEFTTKLSGHHVTIYNKSIDYNHDIYAAMTIEWQFYTEMREWGVKSIGVFATAIYGDVTITNYDNDDKQIEFTFDDKGWKIENITDDLNLTTSITPQDVEIDYETKTVTITF